MSKKGPQINIVTHKTETISLEILNYLDQCASNDDETTYCCRCKFLDTIGEHSLAEERHTHPLTHNVFRLCKKCGDRLRNLK